MKKIINTSDDISIYSNYISVGIRN